MRRKLKASHLVIFASVLFCGATNAEDTVESEEKSKWSTIADFFSKSLAAQNAVSESPKEKSLDQGYFDKLKADEAFRIHVTEWKATSDELSANKSRNPAQLTEKLTISKDRTPGAIYTVEGFQSTSPK